MCFSQLFKSLSMKKGKNAIPNIEQQLSDFDISYWELKLSRGYSHRQFAKLFVNALNRQGIDIETAEPSVVEKALVILAAYFLQVHIGDCHANEGCQDEAVATYKFRLMNADRQNDNDERCGANSLRTYITQIQNEISAALVVISLDHPLILYQNVMDQLIRTYDIPWSFDSFAGAVSECQSQEELFVDEEEVPDYFSLVSEVWKSNLCTLICNASEESLELLCMMDKREALPGCAWHEFFWEYFEEHIRYFSDELVFELVPKVFPEMTTVILQFAMFDAMWGIRWRSMRLILEKMAAYKKYEPASAIFDVETYFDKIISVLIMEDSLNLTTLGADLEVIYQILKDTFEIPEEQLKHLIEYNICDYMLSDKAQTPEGVMHLLRLLPCKVAYDYIDSLNPHIAQAARSYFDFA